MAFCRGMMMMIQVISTKNTEAKAAEARGMRLICVMS